MSPCIVCVGGGGKGWEGGRRRRVIEVSELNMSLTPTHSTLLLTSHSTSSTPLHFLLRPPHNPHAARPAPITVHELGVSSQPLPTLLPAPQQPLTRTKGTAGLPSDTRFDITLIGPVSRR